MESWKKQRKVLAAFGVFLVFMCFCTLVSRVIYASKLPQVSVETPKRMALDHTVTADSDSAFGASGSDRLCEHRGPGDTRNTFI